MRPAWLKVKLARPEAYQAVERLVKSKSLHTVCEAAQCPNIYECWSKRTATFMLLGDICTRACPFCAVKTGKPSGLDPNEPRKVAEAVQEMGLTYVVLTSVTRDDLSDGGARQFAKTITEIRQHNPGVKVEILVSDLQGSEDAVATVLAASPTVFSHNLETVRRLTPTVRAKASYAGSLALLLKAAQLRPDIPVKSSIMVGLGEEWAELEHTLKDLQQYGVSLLAIGQYLSPSPKHLAVRRYYTPAEFEKLRQIGLQLGFRHVVAGPLVRSSYKASDFML
ncbi:MAG: lipoyl synthase [Bacillota bacterium]